MAAARIRPYSTVVNRDLRECIDTPIRSRYLSRNGQWQGLLLQLVERARKTDEAHSAIPVELLRFYRSRDGVLSAHTAFLLAIASPTSAAHENRPIARAPLCVFTIDQKARQT